MAFSLRVPAPPLTLNFDEEERIATYEFVIRVFVYASVLVVFGMVVALMLKLIGILDDVAAAAPPPVVNWTENSRLLPKEAAPIIYGACDDEEDDEESAGKCSRSSSSEDIYDGKICVICYDHKRCCFFVPCGHCATCYQCAKRISEGEAKVCPFCRSDIHMVTRLVGP